MVFLMFKTLAPRSKWIQIMYSIQLCCVRLKVVKSIILDKGPVPKKAKEDFTSNLILTFNFMVRSMVNKYLVSKDVIHNIKGFNTTILAHCKHWRCFSAEQQTEIVLNMICYQVSASCMKYIVSPSRNHSFIILTLLTVIICTIF